MSMLSKAARWALAAFVAMLGYVFAISVVAIAAKPYGGGGLKTYIFAIIFSTFISALAGGLVVPAQYKRIALLLVTAITIVIAVFITLENVLDHSASWKNAADVIGSMVGGILAFRLAIAMQWKPIMSRVGFDPQTGEKPPIIR